MSLYRISLFGFLISLGMMSCKSDPSSASSPSEKEKTETQTNALKNDSAREERMETAVQSNKNESTPSQTVNQNVDETKVHALAFNGISPGTNNVIYRPYFGQKMVNYKIIPQRKERDLLMKSESNNYPLGYIPIDEYFVVGKEVNLLLLDDSSLYAREDEINVPAATKNKIKRIELVKGKYKYDGGDIALEITFEKPLENKKGWYLMSNKATGPLKWNTQSEIQRMNKICADKSRKNIENIYSVKPITDLNGDGFPEFYFPFADSHEGYILSSCIDQNYLQIAFSSGH